MRRSKVWLRAQAFFKPSEVVHLTTQRQEHLNVGDQLGVFSVRQRRNQAFFVAEADRPAYAQRSGGLLDFPLPAMQKPCRGSRDAPEVPPASLGCRCWDAKRVIDSSIMEPFDPRDREEVD
jgi:hypothetical protein